MPSEVEALQDHLIASLVDDIISLDKVIGAIVSYLKDMTETQEFIITEVLKTEIEIKKDTNQITARYINKRITELEKNLQGLITNYATETMPVVKDLQVGKKSKRQSKYS